MEEDFPFVSMKDFYNLENESFSSEFSYYDIKSELLVLSVDLGEGRKDKLIIHENENPELKAIEFCQKNMLGPRIKIALCGEIEKQLENIIFYKNKLPESKKLLRTSSVQAKKLNIGHELYAKGIKMKERVENYNAKAREAKIQDELKDATFQPITNSTIRRKKMPEDILLEKGRQTSEKLARKRSIKEISLISCCTFSPEINKNSTRIKRIEKRSPNRFKFLYHDAESLKEKIQKKSGDL